ncbi:MAG: sulfite exporter TauE/SafE family protein [Parabacteroides sp.]|nr:sulfite exporter TauE/SafE family protein [Parabacteroides sp.]
MLETTVFIFLLSIVASVIQRVSGFGFGIFVMMFFPFILSTFGESLTLSGLLAGTTALLIAIRNWRFIRWNTMWIVLFFNAISSFIAIEYMSSLSNDTLKRCFGVVLVLIALYFLLCEGKLNLLFKSKAAQAIIGIVSGVMGGMFAMPGPPVVLYSIGTIKDNREYLATLQAYSVVFNIFYLIYRMRVGFFSENTLLWWVVGLFGLVIGAWIGARCFERISTELLKKIVYSTMLISGIVAII